MCSSKVLPKRVTTRWKTCCFGCEPLASWAASRPMNCPTICRALLIGAEVKAGLARFGPVDASLPIPLLGSAQLTQRYATAFVQFGQATIEMPGDAVFNGLLAIARAAGLLGRAPSPGLIDHLWKDHPWKSLPFSEGSPPTP